MKKYLVDAINEVVQGVDYPDVDFSPLVGLEEKDFDVGKKVGKKVVVAYLQENAVQLNGAIDERKFGEIVGLLTEKVEVVEGEE